MQTRYALEHSRAWGCPQRARAPCTTSPSPTRCDSKDWPSSLKLRWCAAPPKSAQRHCLGGAHCGRPLVRVRVRVRVKVKIRVRVRVSPNPDPNLGLLERDAPLARVPRRLERAVLVEFKPRDLRPRPLGAHDLVRVRVRVRARVRVGVRVTLTLTLTLTRAPRPCSPAGRPGWRRR